MPIYEYKCDACDHEFEKIQKMSDDPIKVCPECNAESVRKLMSAPGFRLKGGGWYETDFKSDNKRNLVDSGDKKSSTAKSSTDKVKPASASSPQKKAKESKK